MAKLGFTDNDGADVGEKYVTKEYAIDKYPNIFNNFRMGGLWLAGYNANGQLGDNSTTSKNSPVTVSGAGLNWKAVHYANLTTFGLKNDGTLWSWGSATYGTLGNGSSTASRSSPGTTIVGGTDWAALPNSGCSTNSYGAALKTNGVIYTWGRNNSGQLGAGNTTNRSSPLSIVGGITDWVQMACGYNHMMAIRSNGLLYTWGAGTYGALGSNSTANRSSPQTVAGASSGGTNWVYCSAGTNISAGIKSDGTLWTWGSNLFGAIGDGTASSRSSPGTTAGGGTNWKKIATTRDSFTAIKTDGTLWTWGSNSTGQLADGTTNVSKNSPGTTAGGGANWVTCGGKAAIKADGTLWTWGFNLYGELGNGNFGTSRSSPGTTSYVTTGWKTCSADAGSLGAIAEEDGW